MDKMDTKHGNFSQEHFSVPQQVSVHAEQRNNVRKFKEKQTL